MNLRHGLLMSLFVLVALQSSVNGEDSAHAITNAGSASYVSVAFKTQTGIIQCTMVGNTTIAAARCGATVHDWKIPKACAAGWHFVLLKTTIGKSHGSYSCDHGAFPATKRRIGPGKKYKIGSLVCTGSKTGVTCLSNHRGFFISRHSFKRI